MTITSPDSPNWDFSRYQANEVVINLSTNDPGYHAGAPVQYVDTTGWLVRSDFASDDRHP